MYSGDIHVYQDVIVNFTIRYVCICTSTCTCTSSCIHVCMGSDWVHGYILPIFHMYMYVHVLYVHVLVHMSVWVVTG